MKFSIIIPVYNVEKYIAKCLESVMKQTFSDFEVLVINDGSPDNSQAVIDEFEAKHPEKIKSFIKENGGLSDARNYGTERALGEYLLFIDSDDYIAEGLLEKLAEVLDKNAVDVLKFSTQTVFDDGKLGNVIPTPELDSVSGEAALEALIDNKYSFEPAWLYVYKHDFWSENAFSYLKGKYHEDFGLTPEVIIKARSFSSINYVGYFYVQTPTSIMRNSNYSKTIAKIEDTLFHVLRLKGVAEENITTKRIQAKFFSYLANGIISRLSELERNDRKQLISRLKSEGIFEMLLNDTLKRKLKNLYIKLKYGVI